jgi:hypothetical protein
MTLELTPAARGHAIPDDSFRWRLRRAGGGTAFFTQLGFSDQPEFQVAIGRRTGGHPEFSRSGGDEFVTEEGMI